MRIGNKNFDIKNQTYIMGILNVTPDSFSDGGKYNHVDQALFRVKQMQEEGCDILDIGGESTRPGYTKISDEEEIDRVVPVIEAVKSRFDIPISVDTYKSKVARAVALSGADLINDIWGLKYDCDMGSVIAQTNTACCLMHNRENTQYQHFLEDVLNDMGECIALAKKAGISDDKIILDPGVGFAKSYEQNLLMIQNMEVLEKLGYPLLLGTSRKSVVGITLDLPANERVEGTLATTVLAVMKHYAFVRVHDIKENKRVIDMTKEIRDIGKKEL